MSGYNQNSGYGQALLNAVVQAVPTFGRVFVVLDPDDTDEENYQRMQDIFSPDPNGIIRFNTLLATAETSMESNNNDVCLLDTNSTHVLSDAWDISTNRKHFIGMDGGDRLIQQGAKIQYTATSTDSYVMKNTGVRNSFRNLKFIQASAVATALQVAQMGGEGNLYKNCSFVFGVADNLDLTTATEVICGEDSGTFIDCTFGSDTLLTSGARKVFTIDQVTASQEFKSNMFKDCTWMISSSEAGALLIGMAAAGDILFTNHFIRPSLLASLDSAGGVQLTKAIATANGTTKGTIYVSYPMVHGIADIGVNGTNNDNLYVFSHVPSAVDITSAQPTTT